MSNDILQKVTELVEADPQSGQALLLFALMSTLNIEKTGHMYMLGKLKEFTPENRQYAYALMEMMASNQIHDDSWQQAMERIGSAVRG